MPSLLSSTITMETRHQRRRRSILLVLALTGVIGICLPKFLLDVNIQHDHDETITVNDEEDAQMYRLLSTLGDAQTTSGEEDLSIPDYLLHAGEVGHPSVDEALALALSHATANGDGNGDSSNINSQPSVPPPYNLLTTLQTRATFRNTFGILVYDPQPDAFLLLYHKNEAWTSGCVKLKKSFEDFVFMLRSTFPQRFCGPECEEWMVGITSGDYPHFHPYCLTNFPHGDGGVHCKGSLAPVFQFGSVFREFDPLPNMIAMPMPLKHMTCFKSWVVRNSTVCQALRGSDTTVEGVKGTQGTLVFNENVPWEELTPQVVWRGTDFGYLGHLAKVDSVETGRAPRVEWDIPQEVQTMEDDVERRVAATQALRDGYHQFMPRWKGVILTAEAHREAEAKVLSMNNEENENVVNETPTPILPWADIQFTAPSGDNWIKQRKQSTYHQFSSRYGIPATGQYLNAHQLSTYKYHIDLGGGGGTTWTGTTQKLAMPGLLFHHVTPTKDYIHDWMLPYVHYVPIKADLSDLKAKYEWAESHPEVAKRIAHEGSMLMRRIGTTEGFGELFEEYFVQPVRRVLEAYEPISKTHPELTSWREVIKQEGGSHAELVVRERCSGRSSNRKEDCTTLGPNESL